jgi:hypothetical protein
MDHPQVIQQKQATLKKAFGKSKGIKYNWNDPQESLLEAALARGDRRVGKAVLMAWQKGCRFDAWHEQFQPDLWWQAFAEAGLDPHWYATRARTDEEDFPWDHVNAGVNKRWLLMDWQAAQEGTTRVDCRHTCFGCGILSTFSHLRDKTGTSDWACPLTTKSDMGE